MEHLFNLPINIGGSSIPYRVIFKDERYTFVPDTTQPSIPSFSFRREHDEWVEEELLSSAIKTQAIDALERYLLRQH